LLKVKEHAAFIKQGLCGSGTALVPELIALSSDMIFAARAKHPDLKGKYSFDSIFYRKSFSN
jgi:hypothetical protein